ncbi:MAG: glycosyltransferase family 2 protein [Opitutaceae bacterium]
MIPKATSPIEDNLLSIIIPFLNEEEVLPMLRARFERIEGMPPKWELILVSDGSTDGSIALVEQWTTEDPRVRLVVLSRNFGHQAAVTAGLSFVSGDFVAIMDADLQDEPEVMLELLATAQEGYDVVYATREKRKSTLWKRCAYSAFYWLYGKLAETPVHLDSGDFCVLSRRAVDILNALPERVRFVRGLRSWIGLRSTSIGVHRPDRAGGVAQYNMVKLIKLAMTGLTSFSTKPLRLAIGVGFCLCIVAIALAVFYLIKALVFDLHSAAPGFATIVILLLFLNGVTMLLLGIIGEYLSQIFIEVKHRPTFVVERLVNLPE